MASASTVVPWQASDLDVLCREESIVRQAWTAVVADLNHPRSTRPELKPRGGYASYQFLEATQIYDGADRPIEPLSGFDTVYIRFDYET